MPSNRESATRYSTTCVLVGATAFVLYMLPVLLFYARYRAVMPFLFFAPDSFYYLGIARHSAHLPFFSFDGIHPTNGFHPMWEWVEYLASKLPFFNLDNHAVLQRFLALNFTLLAVDVALFAAVIYTWTRRFWLSVLAVTPGFVWLFAGIGSAHYLNNWSYANGMETGMALLFFALALLFFGRTLQQPGWRFVAGTLCLGLTVLSRLDDIFFLAVIFFFVLYLAPPAQRLHRFAVFCLPGALIAAYLLYNHYTVGLFMPISGLAKAGRGLPGNFGWLKMLITGRALWVMDPGAIGYFFDITYMECLDISLPFLIGGVYLFWARRHTGRNPLLAALALGMMLKSLYNFVVVGLGFQGSWYYGVSLACCNLLLGVIFTHYLDRPPLAPATELTPGGRGLRFAAAFLAMAVVQLVAFNIIVVRKMASPAWPADYALYQRGDIIAQHIKATGHPLFLEFDDGISSFATGLPSLSGFGLPTDLEAARAQKSGTYFDLLARRGITVAVAATRYPYPIEQSHTSKAVFPGWGFNAQEVQHYRFDPFWSDPASGVVLYHIEREPSPAH